MAVVAVLKGKGLVRPEPNRNGWPFWRLTTEGLLRVDAASALAMASADEKTTPNETTL
jgi:hypothetical protein